MENTNREISDFDTVVSVNQMRAVAKKWARRANHYAQERDELQARCEELELVIAALAPAIGRGNV